ncbi:MAG TPA: anthranilate synthase component I [Rhodospirillaceae bacterium]|nr:anthranilate synthase component I [Rhodospirillaceae bacterium]
MTALPALSDFTANYNSGKTQLVWQWVPADLETPVSAYMKLCGKEEYSFLLESVEGGATLGRYSIIGFSPDIVWECVNGEVRIRHDWGSKDLYNAAPLESLRRLLADCRIDATDPEVPPMAVSGLFGYLGYDMVRQIESIPDKNPDDLRIPESIMIRPTVLAIFDNVKNRMCLVTPVYQHAQNSKEKAEAVYAEAGERLSGMIKKLMVPLDSSQGTAKTKLTAPLEVTSNTSREEYHGMVKKAVEYIRAGEIFQVVPSQRFSAPFDLPSFSLYRSLRGLNPSPFMFHLSFKNFSLVGSSPEILVRVRGGKVTIRPIAGTRPRGKDDAEDKALAEGLLNDPKERAEHLMLLDLGRNDVGRIAQTGSVKVTDQFTIERYSHVMHIVSNVEGKLREDMDILDALFAGFPAGTVSGAPKVRAMEIIDELEKSRRSYYAGGVGYLSGNGEMDTCIALRTALVKNEMLYVQAGGGVVADSDPEYEYQESCNKARAVIRAAQLALDTASRQEPS